MWTGKAQIRIQKNWKKHLATVMSETLPDLYRIQLFKIQKLYIIHQKEINLWLKAGWQKYCSSLLRPRPLPVSPLQLKGVCVSVVRLCKITTAAAAAASSLVAKPKYIFLFWLQAGTAAAAVVVWFTSKAEVCRIQTVQITGKFMQALGLMHTRTHTHAHIGAEEPLDLARRQTGCKSFTQTFTKMKKRHK